MSTYDSNHVKNIALLGHAGSGKTTLAEAMLFDAGITKRRGSVAEKNTVSDYHELETERTSLVSMKWVFLCLCDKVIGFNCFSI